MTQTLIPEWLNIGLDIALTLAMCVVIAYVWTRRRASPRLRRQRRLEDE